ncbi:endo-1,4-beta-xylanase-like protein [Legionella steigerwaltii]|uniref:Endo-1,4-beta-xylanase-like protein n=1 Tax=Legionella steigerwaltii TaxID=460 RepID=A0A378L4D7_9GAMM|nr:RsiV family protein [Legionella steigerwaltii]KTD77229.1 endo-1,4-beta-xylanase-like protein [Legionella steigerwaltii]STY21955.1 endo-1,4-beta-xylanase-like protein [Legionella steigerwaltii]
MFYSLKNRVILMVFGCFLISIAYADPLPPLSLWTNAQDDSRPLLVLNQKNQLVPKTVQTEKTRYLLQLRYPQIVGSPLPQTAKDFNHLLQSFVDKEINQFRHVINQTTPTQSMEVMQNHLKINYDLAGFVSQSQHTEYISIRFRRDSFVQGMAHPGQQIQTFNFDLGHNKLLSLSNLFKPNSNYLDKISSYCSNQLSSRKFPAEMIKAGAGPRMENYKNWNLTLSGLLITFDEAQVAPRYKGVQEVLIPYEVLKSSYTHETACTLFVINCDVT